MVVDGGGLQRKTVTSILWRGCLLYRRRFFFLVGCTGYIAVDLTFLKMPGPGDRAFPF